jgi:uncharacterized protein (DUF983 family)
MRGIARHCPRCGGRGVCQSWFKLRDRCPGCGMRFERGEDDFWLGGYVINFASGEAGIMVLLALLIGLLANGQHINAALFVGVGAVIAVLGPVATFPASRTTWSAIDLIMRPLSEEEVTSAQATVAEAAMRDEVVIPPGTRRDPASS